MTDSTKLTPRGISLAFKPPNDILDAAELNKSIDRMTEIHHAALDEAFEWSIERFAHTYRDLA